MSQNATPDNPFYTRDISFGLANANVPAGAGTTVIKATGGILSQVVVVTTGNTNPVTFYDWPTATGATSAVVLASIAAGQAVGTNIVLRLPAELGIVAVGGTTTPQVTVAYS